MTSPSHASFKIVEQDGSAVTIAVSGEIDIASAPALRSYLSERLSEGYTEITLDLTKMTFIDSSGLGVIVGVINRLRLEEGRLIICNPPPIAVQVLSVSGLTPSLEIVTRNPAEALDRPAEDA
jgi:anti-sigma B factor antagonist